MPDEFQTLKKERCIEIIKACNGSGMPKRQWCREHGISYSTFMRWQRSLRNELAGKIMVTQAVVPLQIEPQASRCTPAQEVTIQKDGISISMHGVSSDMVNVRITWVHSVSRGPPATGLYPPRAVFFTNSAMVVHLLTGPECSYLPPR